MRVDIKNANAHYNLGAALAPQGKLGNAIECFRNALRIDPDYAGALGNQGTALMLQKNLPGAIAHSRHALRINPHLEQAHDNLSAALASQGKLDEALQLFRDTIEREPQAPAPRAVQEAAEADRLSNGKSPEALHVLAAAHAENGDFDQAIKVAKRALVLALKNRNSILADRIRIGLELYEMGFPNREDR